MAAQEATRLLLHFARQGQVEEFLQLVGPLTFGCDHMVNQFEGQGEQRFPQLSAIKHF